MIGRRAIAILTVLSAHTMAVLGDLSRDPTRIGQSSDQIADQLRFADAASVSTDDDQPAWRRFLCGPRTRQT
jgi:hypothetical protein